MKTESPSIGVKRLEEVKDANGSTLSIGDVCIYLGDSTDADEKHYRGRRVVIRDIKPPNRDPSFIYQRGPKRGQPIPGSIMGAIHLRIDDDVGNPDEADKWSWSAWVNSESLAFVAARSDKAGER